VQWRCAAGRRATGRRGDGDRASRRVEPISVDSHSVGCRHGAQPMRSVCLRMIRWGVRVAASAFRAQRGERQGEKEKGKKERKEKKSTTRDPHVGCSSTVEGGGSTTKWLKGCWHASPRRSADARSAPSTMIHHPQPPSRCGARSKCRQRPSSRAAVAVAVAEGERDANGSYRAMTGWAGRVSGAPPATVGWRLSGTGLRLRLRSALPLLTPPPSIRMRFASQPLHSIAGHSLYIPLHRAKQTRAP